MSTHEWFKARWHTVSLETRYICQAYSFGMLYEWKKATATNWLEFFSFSKQKKTNKNMRKIYETKYLCVVGNPNPYSQLYFMISFERRLKKCMWRILTDRLFRLTWRHTHTRIHSRYCSVGNLLCEPECFLSNQGVAYHKTVSISFIWWTSIDKMMEKRISQAHQQETIPTQRQWLAAIKNLVQKLCSSLSMWTLLEEYCFRDIPQCQCIKLLSSIF